MLVNEWMTRQAETDAFAAFDAATLAIGKDNRNATLSRFAGRVLIRYGDTEQAHTLMADTGASRLPDRRESEMLARAYAAFLDSPRR